MTTYLLHGGATSKLSLENDMFFREFSLSVDRPSAKILCCYWALDEHSWNEKFLVDKSKIESLADKPVTIDMVTNPEELENQIRRCDVFYVAGGYINNIESYYNHLINLKIQLSGKVYIGSSVGSFLVSQYFVTSFESEIEFKALSGLGFLPTNILCHWNIEEHKEHKIDLLKATSPEFPILSLNEGQFIRIIY